MSQGPDSSLERYGDDPLVVAGTPRLQLSNWQKMGVAGLVAFVFLTFIWVDNALHAKNAHLETTIQPNLAAFQPTPLNLSAPVEAPAPAVARPAGNEITSAQSPILAFGGGGGGADAIVSAAESATGAPPAARSGGQVVPALATAEAGGVGGLAGKLKPTELQGAKAELLPHPDMVITKGTIIPCTLLTAINTELAGFVKCVLPEAVRGATGNVVLMDKGTTVVGEIQQGLTNGQDRVFILWDRAETPNHAILSLGSPGADELGRAGVPGAVNNHFWQRFSAALMLSVVQGALQAGAAASSGANSNSSTGLYFNNFSSNGQQLANTALENSINIPPTLEKAQGGNVSIFIARDIDFSDVYRLATVR